jgi:hypothetical protein
MTEKILGKHTQALSRTLGLTQGGTVIATGISGQTLADLGSSKREDLQLSPSYSLVYRVLSAFPHLSPIKPPISMSDFTSFVRQHTGVSLGNEASILLGQQKTWYYKARMQAALSPAASNLALLYMHLIKSNKPLMGSRNKGSKCTGLDAARQIAEKEAHSRGLDRRILWKHGTWPRNKILSESAQLYPTPEDTSDSITSRDVKRMLHTLSKDSKRELSYIELSFFFGVTQHRMIELCKKYAHPLEIPPNTGLLVRCLEAIPEQELPFTLPTITPREVFDVFAKHGLSNKHEVSVYLGLKGSNHRNMEDLGSSKSYTERLGYYIAKGCKLDPGFMGKYLEIVNQDAMSRGMANGDIFKTHLWPIEKAKHERN